MSKTQPCPGCGRLGFVLGSKAFSNHFRDGCSKTLLKQNNTAQHKNTNNIDSPLPVPVFKFYTDHLGNPTTEISTLQSRATISPYALDRHGGPISQTAPMCLDTQFSESEDSNETGSHAAEDPHSPDVDICGGYRFQVQLMDILQRHKADLKNA